MAEIINNTDEHNICNDSSVGEYISVGNYLTRPEKSQTGKIAVLPLPTIEIHNGCKSVFSKSEYYVKLENELDIYERDKITVVIVLNLHTPEYDFVAEDFGTASDNEAVNMQEGKNKVEIKLYACFNGGIHEFKLDDYATTAGNGFLDGISPKIVADCATISFTYTFIPDQDGDFSDSEKHSLLCVNALKYQFCVTTGSVRIKRRPCSYKLLKQCVEYPYTGTAYVTLKSGQDDEKYTASP